MSEPDNRFSNGLEAGDIRRQRQKTWPSLIFTALIVAFWSGVISAVTGLGAASLSEPSERWAPVLAFGAVVALVLTAIGWIAHRLFLIARRSPINDLRNIAVILGAGLLAIGPALLVAQSDLVHRQVTREPASYQAYVIDDEYSLGLHDASTAAGLEMQEALGQEGLIPTHLRNRSSLPDLRARLDRARATLVAHETRVTELQAEALQRVQAADMNDWERQLYIDQFQNGFDDVRPIFEQRNALYRRLFDLQERQIDVLEQSRGWEVTSGGVAFSNASDLAAYNALAGQINAAVAELQTIEAEVERRDAEYEAQRRQQGY